MRGAAAGFRRPCSGAFPVVKESVMADVIGLITARGGSKGVPKKNVRAVGGRPLIAWTIEAARGSSMLGRVIVSTDDPEIADVAIEWGAEVPFMRPPELAKDASSHISVVTHAIEWLDREEGCRPEYVLLLQPTSPLRTAEDIDGAIRMATEKRAEAVVGVTETHVHPYLTRRITCEGTLIDFVPCDIAYARRQDLPPAFFVNGAIYLNRRESLLGKQKFVPEGTYGYVMPEERSLQVDTAWDLHLIDLVLNDRERCLTAPLR
jgi:CMP-N,N'-diacetyllegionaminic acid synthase